MRSFEKNTAATYSPSKMQVPSAMRGLTSLFGKGRGEHPRQNHHKKINLDIIKTIIYILGKIIVRKKIKLTGN